MTIPNHLDVVQRGRVIYADRTGTDRAHAICAYVSWQLRAEPEGQWGRFLKADGSLSADVIALKTQTDAFVYTYDILGDSEGAAKPQWAPTTPTGHGDLSRWRAATIPPTPTPQPEPEPEPEPEPTPVACALAIALEKRVAELERHNALMAAEMVDLSRRIAALEHTEYDLNTSTSRNFGFGQHSHQVVTRVTKVP